MQCPRCHAQNREDRRFCCDCGLSFADTCTSCGFLNEGSEKFCGGCGRSLTAVALAERKFNSARAYTPKHLAERILNSRAALEGERKQVTVLFADMKGSLELLADRDPEDARKILDPVIQHMIDAVHRYEGTVNQVMGDGIMALFGAPVAHEDHAVRACYSALRMQDAVKRYAEEALRAHGVTVQVRIGLNSGEVVVRAIGSDLRMDYTAVGQTTHLAARMEQLATPGSILVAPATVALVEGFVEVKSLGPVPVRGLAEPIDVHEVTGAGAARTRLHAVARRGLTRFVGRSAELRHLRRVQELAANGRGQVAAIVGEAGVGKSRLVYEFARSHRLRGWLVLQASVSYGRATSYLPVVDVLRAYFAIDDRDDARAMREKVTGKVLALDRALEPVLPALLALLDVPLEDEAWRLRDASDKRHRTLDAVKRVLLREAHQRPVLLIFEDLHWIDGETQAVLDGLVDALGSARLLVLVNYRPEYAHAWGSKSSYSQIRLDTLAAEGAGELLEALLGNDAALDPLKRDLVKRGNPFFLEETIRTLVATGVLAGERGAYRPIRSVDAIRVPPTVQVVLAARIDRLAPADKRLLQMAAVIGKETPFSILQIVAGVPEPELRGALERLQAADFVHETGLYPDLEYSFNHVLTHEVTYGTLLSERRRELHRAVLEALETSRRDGVGGDVERLAHHAFCAAAWDKAVMYARLAAARAMELSAYAQARACYDQALEALARLPESRETLHAAVELLHSCSAPQSALGELDRQLQTAEEALRAAERLGDPLWLARLSSAVGFARWQLGDNVRAREFAERGVALAESAGHAVTIASARLNSAMICRSLGDYHAAIDHVMPAVEILSGDRVRERADRAVYPAITTRSVLISALAELGDFDRALTIAHENVDIATALGQPLGMVVAASGINGVRLRRGEFQAAIRSLEHTASLCRTARLANWFPEAAANLGHAYARTGRARDAVSLLEDARRAAAAVARRVEALTATYLADAYLQAGRPGEATIEAMRVLTLVRARSERGAEARILYVLGEIALRGGTRDVMDAEARYREALAAATDLGMRPLVAHCHAGLAAMYWRAGKDATHAEHFHAAATMYRQMGMNHWLNVIQTDVRAAR